VSALVLAVALAACDAAAPAAPGPGASPTVAPTAESPTPLPRPAVAFVQDLSPEGAPDRLLPVYRAFELAFAAARVDPEDPLDVELVAFDTSGDLDVAAEIATQILEDDRFAVAIAAPDLPGQSDLVSWLSASGVPVVSLSARGSPTDPPAGTWLRLVAPVREQAVVLAEAVAGLRRAADGVCVLRVPADGTALVPAAARLLAFELEVVEVTDVAAVGAAGCGVVVWTGDSAGGAELPASLSTIAPHPPILAGGPNLRDPSIVGLTQGIHAVAVCSCVDLSTSLDLEAQRLIQDFQTEYGRAPGSYVVEAWDAAEAVLAALREAGPARAGIRGWLAGATELDGLGGPYVFDTGELADPRSYVRVYRIRGGRWLEVAPPSNP
jgi:hypothetical protein